MAQFPLGGENYTFYKQDNMHFVSRSKGSNEDRHGGSTLKRLKQGDCPEFKAKQGFVVRSCLNNNKNYRNHGTGL